MMRAGVITGRLRRRGPRQEVGAVPAPCETAPNGTGAQCTCTFDCANYWLRAKGLAEIKTGRSYHADITDRQLAAYRFAAMQPAPRPTFTPRRPQTAITAPMDALPSGMPLRPASDWTTGAPRHVPAATDLLERVRDALLAGWVAETFKADKRDLPCFDAATKTAGWQGLHMPPRRPGWQRWVPAGWAERERERADDAYVIAREQAHAALDDIQARVARALPVSAGSR